MPDAANALNGPAWAAGLLVVPTLFYLVRREWSRYLQRQMMATAGIGAAAHGDEEPAANGPLAQVQVQVQVQVQMPVQVHTADSVARQASEARRRQEAQASRDFVRLCLFDLCAALGYLVLPRIAGRFGATVMSDVGRLISGVLIAILPVRYLVHRRQFRAFNLARSRQRQRIYRLLRFFLMLPMELATAAFNPFRNLVDGGTFVSRLVAPRTRSALSIAIITLAVLLAGLELWQGMSGSAPTIRFDAIGLIAAAALHAWTLGSPRRGLAAHRGVALLVLRVFHVELAASFLFNGLMTYWRHFGSHFAVVDPAFLVQVQRRRPLRNLAWLVASYAALAYASVTLASWTSDRHAAELTAAWIFLLVIVPALLMAWAVLALGKIRIEHRFIRDKRQLLQRLHKLDRSPRHADLSFRHLRAPCHDDTWLLAVAEFAQRSRVVLMDLRGYLASNQGCRREVAHLFGASMIDRSLFLVGSAGDVPAVHEMLVKQWRQGPGNTAIDVGTWLNIYIVQDGDERDMQAIIDLLMQLAESVPEASAPVPRG